MRGGTFDRDSAARRWLAGLLLLPLSLPGVVFSQSPPAPPAAQSGTTPPVAPANPNAQGGSRTQLPVLPPPLRMYQGRVIAQTMHYTGAEWLTRDTREREERCSLLLANLGIKTGMTVCDMGCGNGFYALQIAKMIGPQGKMLGVDIQPEMLRMLTERAKTAGVDNVTPILGTVADPKLPEGQVDLLLCVDVYHEFSHPVQMLAAMRRALSPTGLVALVEFRAEDRQVPIKPEHKMTKAQILKEWRPNGFELVKEFDGLPWQHLMFFRRADLPSEP